MIQQLLKLDDYGRQIHTEDSAIDLIYHNPTVNLSNLEFDKDTIQSFNNACEMLYVEDRLKSVEELEITPDQYHKSNQQKWHMPDEYKNLDIAKQCLDLCETEEQIQRVGKELLMYEDRKLFPLLRFLKYMVDTLRENNIVWGVGRGSSVASYVLYLIGIHKIDSLYYDLDVEEFLELRKNTGDDRRRTHDMNTANWIPDLFMKRLEKDEEWTLFSPSDVPDLHDIYGLEFEKKYVEYEKKAEKGDIKLFKKVKAKDLWRKVLSMLFETGHPWVTFKDPCNIRSPQGHVGTVHSSNLCTEITLNTNKDEIAVCNLGSINLPQHIDDGKINVEQLKSSIKTAIRMLDNVVDINFYPVPQAENSNKKHRPIGLGLMGFQDALYKLGISYNSDEAVDFADKSMELVSYFAIQASSELAKERGAYETYEGSLWDKGIFPIDSINLLAEQRGKEFIDQNTDTNLDWDSLKASVSENGMRNSNVMAIAPTATIANITGVSQSIEPTYQNLFVKSNLSGEFTVVNPYLIEELKKENLWDDVMLSDLKYFEGSLSQINRIPEATKERFKTAFEIEPRFIVEAASRRQKWIDQAQSLNLYIGNVDGKKLDVTYRMAWYKGLKTTYYLRSMGATATEKSTVDRSNLNAVETNQQEQQVASKAPEACSILDPDCEACQ